MFTCTAVSDVGGDVVPGGPLAGRVGRAARQAHRHEQADACTCVRLVQKKKHFILSSSITVLGILAKKQLWLLYFNMAPGLRTSRYPVALTGHI